MGTGIAKKNVIAQVDQMAHELSELAAVPGQSTDVYLCTEDGPMIPNQLRMTDQAHFRAFDIALEVLRCKMPIDHRIQRDGCLIILA